MKRAPWKREDTHEGSLYLAKILRWYNAGWPSVAIGHKLGKDHTTVLYHLRKMGIPKGSRRGYHRSSEFLQIDVEVGEVVQKKGGKYDHFFDEPINPGKRYREYLADSGKTPVEIHHILREKQKAARWGGNIVSLPSDLLAE